MFNLVGLIISQIVLLSFALGVHSELTIIKDKNEVSAVKIEPKEHLVINEEAPWKLEIFAKDPKSVDKLKPIAMLDRSKLDLKIPGFKISSGEIKNGRYIKVTAYVCTKDKKQCFRDVLTQQL